MYTLEDYKTADGRIPFANWLLALTDLKAKAKVLSRLQRLSAGSFGDCKPIKNGLWELRIDHAAGYRIYYTQSGKYFLLLLIGGDKSTQQADIDKALSYLADWHRRKKHE